MPCSMELLIVVFCHSFSDRYGISHKLHETRKLQKMNEKIRFLSFSFQQKEREGNILILIILLTSPLESSAPYSNLFG